MKTWIEISASALRENYERIAAFVAPSQVMAVVKANAYGHGLKEVGQVLKGTAKSYAVDRVSEGVVLRQLGIHEPILVLGYSGKEELKEAIREQLDLAISSFEQLQQLRFTTQELGALARPVQIHLEVETGLHRLGIPGSDISRIGTELQAIGSAVQVRGIFTHFANAEEELDAGFPVTQRERFVQIVADFKAAGIVPEVLHMACSAAAFAFPASRFETIRLGISLYGQWSDDAIQSELAKRGAVPALTPVLRWKTIIAQVKDVPAGETIGYDRSETVTRASKIAVLPIGYYDGYPRSLSSKGNVVIQGTRCRIIGRICMNMCMVDVTDLPELVKAGTEVTLIGPGIEAAELAKLAGTINYELLARLAQDLPRIVVE